ncbi:MAG TPA: hypothetical protein VK252_02515, partial [Solirubrobacteraceae bacterium]|nr:hypothetical protein [Solirubrobacteraceae bacterium]
MTVCGNGEDRGLPAGLGATSEEVPSVAASGSLARSPDGASERDLMVQALAALFACGATLALLTIALPHSARASELGLLVIVGIAYAIAAALHWRTRALAGWVLPAALLVGSTLITGVAYFSGQNPSPLVFFYLWVFLYSSYFFSTTETVVQIVYVGL